MTFFNGLDKEGRVLVSEDIQLAQIFHSEQLTIMLCIMLNETSMNTARYKVGRNAEFFLITCEKVTESFKLLTHKS